MIGKQAGVWIDHRKAVIVLLSDAGEQVQVLDSDMEKHVRFTGGRASEDGDTEDTRDRQFELHLNRFYDRVITVLRQADRILIFGPGEAKNELHKRLAQKGLKERLLPPESADKLTDAQVAAKVRRHFPR
jgi:stalled ribosome rescue protein Dom34